MAMNTFACKLPLDEIPKGFVATSHDGHLVEVDVNRYTGVVYIKYPRDCQSLMFVSRVFKMAEETGFLYDMINHPEIMEDAIYSKGVFQPYECEDGSYVIGLLPELRRDE